MSEPEKTDWICHCGCLNGTLNSVCRRCGKQPIRNPVEELKNAIIKQWDADDIWQALVFMVEASYERAAWLDDKLPPPTAEQIRANVERFDALFKRIEAKIEASNQLVSAVRLIPDNRVCLPSEWPAIRDMAKKAG